MLLNKKITIYLLRLVLVVYVMFYLCVLKIQLLNINNLKIAKFFVLFFMPLAWLTIVKFSWSKKESMRRLFYLTIASFLVLFFISSIFIFKIEDIFFWHENKKIANEFFKFSFWMLGMNYIFALPYLGFLVTEITFFLSHKNLKRN